MNWFELLRHDLGVVYPVVLALETGRYIITAGVVSLIVWIFWRACFERRKIQDRPARIADLRREIAASLRTAFIFSIIGFSIYLARKTGWLTIYEDFTVRGLGYLALSLIAMIVAHDAYFYWTHRAMHHPLLFRHFHLTHHKSRTPTPWAAYAFDVPEAIVMLAFVPIWLIIVPMHELAIFIFMSWQIVRNVMGHAGVELSPVSGRPSHLFGWLSTTTHHDLHHQDARTNFGLYFTWWDRLMGTEHLEYHSRLAGIAARNGRPLKGVTAIRKVAPPILSGVVCAGLTLNIAAPGEASAEPRPEIYGRWATDHFGSLVEFAPCPAEQTTICGRIVWLWEPNDPAGHARTDVHNPDASLRTRPLSGTEIMRGLRETAPGIWSGGSLYNPDDGRTYTGTIRLKDRVLQLTGCALVVFCETQTWRRPADVIATMRGN